jgi:Asp-tRNA(Asn)/Glu-tRNA(Gln) amidotransferase A subunit family amidase
VTGFKPSFGALDLAGVQPLAPSLDHLGLLAADAATAARVFAALTGRPAPDGPVPDGPAPGPGDLCIGLVTDQLGHPALAPEVRGVLQDAITALRAAVAVTEVDGAVFGQLG